MVMDHEARVVYACRSPRTDPELVRQFAAEIGYRPVLFRALDKDGRPIYHTNVMMCIGEGFAVLCPTAISDPEERRTIAGFLETSGHENVYITPEQMAAFAGNMLHLKNDRGERFIVLSKAAFQTLEKNQLKKLELYGELLPIDVSVIEETEGGSVRCMMAEIFLEPRN